MARFVIREPQSRPLSDYDVLDFENLPSGYRGLIVEPGYIPRTLNEVDVSAPLIRYRPGETKPKIMLKIPIMSAAMQSVSGYRMGIALARMGGMAVIYQSQSVEHQAWQIKNVKRQKGAFIEPEVVAPDVSLPKLVEHMKETGFTKFFVTENGDRHGILLGVITESDFDEKRHASLTVRERMRPKESLGFAYDDEIGYSVEMANERVLESHHSAIPIIFRDGRLRDVVFKKAIKAHRLYENELTDEGKKLMVAGAVNTQDYRERVPALVEAGVDVLVIDTSQGHTDFVYDTAAFIRSNYSDKPLIGGNVVTKDGFRFLVEKCEVDAVKVGMGIGAICITPDQIGVAKGQDKAVEDVASARDEHFVRTGWYYPVIADGGIRSVRDMNVALSFDADVLMLGKFLAGVDETPTEIDYRYSPPRKPYWGEGSARARQWRENRGYNPSFDEGIPITVPYVGPLEGYLKRAMIQLKDGIRKTGSRSISELHRNAVITTISEEDAKPVISSE